MDARFNDCSNANSRLVQWLGSTHLEFFKRRLSKICVGIGQFLILPEDEDA